MTSWRTLNKRARRKRERDAQFMRDSEHAIKALENLVNRVGAKTAEQGVALAFKAFGESMQAFAAGFEKACQPGQLRVGETPAHTKARSQI